MYKIRKQPTCSEALPVATVPSVLRNKFQFFVGEDRLRYFDYVERYRQKGDVLKRVAVVVQNQLLIADLEGNAKRCIDISSIKTIFVDVQSREAKFLIIIPKEYDILLRVLRSGMSLMRAIVMTSRSMNMSITIATKTLDNPKIMNLKCPEGHRKKRAFQLSPKLNHPTVHSPISIASTHAKEMWDCLEFAIPALSPSKCVKFNENKTRLPAATLPVSGDGLLENSVLFSEGSVSVDDEATIANHNIAVADIRRRSIHANSVLSTEDAAVASTVALLALLVVEKEVSSVELPSVKSRFAKQSSPGSLISVGSPTSTIWSLDDYAQVFYRQDDGYMKWVDCSVVSAVGDTFTIKLHITRSNPEAATLTVRRPQIRRSREPDETCLPRCWCYERSSFSTR
eukprot:TRINITY_DN3054_c0_g1_i2.p1 TRINITY_DN3054_c0_g1~~TRINITY_DN3054_c0_g1_i2.p1  ORF type:complete len:398 (+),score=48.23 TRINITY_DN3054_c0_g1_i2:787-1980(+)